MNKLLFLLVAGVLIIAAPGLAQEPTRTSLAVYQIKAAGQADKSLGSAMTSLLSSKLTQSLKLKVIEEGMLKTVMERQAMNASDACDDTSCQVEIGKLVKAQKLITGDLVKLGSKYILSLKLIDIQSGANEFSTEDQCACSEDQLDGLVDLAAVKVRNHFGENLALPALAAPAPAAPVPGPAPFPQGTATIYLHYQRNVCGGKRYFFLEETKVSLKEDQCVKKAIRAGNQIVRSSGGNVSDQTFSFAAVPGENYYIDVAGICPLNAAKMRNGVFSQLPASPPPAWAGNCQ